MTPEIEAMQLKLLSTVTDLGGMAQNLDEARDWAKDGRTEEALLSLEAVMAGAEDAVSNLRAIALKIAEVQDRKAVAR